MNKSNTPQIRYKKKCIKQFILDVNINTEKEIIDKLLSTRPYATYIKSLIKQDISNSKKSTE